MRQTRVAKSTFNYTVMLPDYVSLAYRVTYWHRPKKVYWYQIWPGNTQGSRFLQLALCIQWLSIQTIKLRRENIVWDLKTYRGKRNVNLRMSTYTE